MEDIFLDCLGEVGDATDRLLGRKLGRALKFVPHHLAHAASAYYPSGFDAAAILVIDGDRRGGLLDAGARRRRTN